jgi:hypothetical protein
MDDCHGSLPLSFEGQIDSHCDRRSIISSRGIIVCNVCNSPPRQLRHLALQFHLSTSATRSQQRLEEQSCYNHFLDLLSRLLVAVSIPASLTKTQELYFLSGPLRSSDGSFSQSSSGANLERCASDTSLSNSRNHLLWVTTE